VYVFVGQLFFRTDTPFVCYEAVSADYSIDAAFTLKGSFRFVVFFQTDATARVIKYSVSDVVENRVEQSYV
jgi:hypothetical protein